MVAGNGFNIKPSGKSWGKVEAMLKNIYVSFVMDGTCAALDLVCAMSVFSAIFYILSRYRQCLALLPRWSPFGDLWGPT